MWGRVSSWSTSLIQSRPLRKAGKKKLCCRRPGAKISSWQRPKFLPEPPGNHRQPRRPSPDATGWPGTMKTMAAWFGLEERGRVMAWWSTCYQVGELASTALASYLIAEATVGSLNQRLGLSFTWQYAFWLPCLGLALIGILFA